MKGRLSTKGRRYTIGGEVVHPRQFVGRDGFKFVNHIAAWARGKGGGALGEARRWIEQRVVGLGLKVMRSPTEVDLWNTGYWVDPPNERGIVKLDAKPGSSFRLSALQRKIIRMYVLLGREYNFFIEVPWCWTIKHPAEDFDDPRVGNLTGEAAEKEVSVWNEHYLANIGRYLRKLRDEGDGEGKSRVDPGYIPIISEAANEYHTLGGARWSRNDLAQIFRRWHTRDTPTMEGGQNYEILGVSMGGPVRWLGGGLVPEPYEPRLDLGHGSPDDIRIHPPRDIEIPWWRIGEHIDAADYVKKYPKPVYINETILLATKKVLNQYPKWKGGLGTSDSEHYWQMMDDLLNRGYYVTIHDFDGMGAGWMPGWTPSEPNEIDDQIREFMGAPGPGPTPPPPEPPPPVGAWRTVHERPGQYRVQEWES